MKRIGIVGAGIIGQSHKEAMVKNTGCRLVAVCDIVIEKAQEIAEGTGANVYTDYKEMARAEELDAVILNLPHFLHKDVTIYFLERGIAVLVEKPMANSVEECDAMIAAAKSTNTLLAVGHVQRYFEAYRKLREIITNETLGKLCLITESRNTHYFSDARPKWFFDKAKAGGGILMNYGAHSLDKILYVTGASIAEVSANGNNFLNDADVEAAAQVMLRLSNGASAVLSYSGCYAPYMEEVIFYFTDGCAKITGAKELWISEKGNDYQLVNLDYSKLPLEEQLAEFLKLLNEEESEVVRPEYGKEVIRVLEEAFQKIGDSSVKA